MAKRKQTGRTERKSIPGRDVVRGTQRRQARPTILLVPSGENPDVEARLLERSRQLGWNLLDNVRRGEIWPPHVDPQGAIVFVPNGEDLDELMKRGCPTVRVGRAPHPNDVQVPAAVPDRLAAGRMAAEHFEERSFRHVGFVGFNVEDGDPVQWPLFDGLRSRATDLGCKCHLLSFANDIVRGAASEPEKYRRRLEWFADQIREIPKPVGLFVFSDAFACTLCCMCEDLGLAVPRDVAILGIGNDDLRCERTVPPVSSIALDHVAQADAVVQLLQQRMAGEPIAQPTVMIPPLGVVARESTNTIGTLDPRVSAAIHYVWDHLDLDLSVDDIAREVGVARRTLDRAFQTHLHHGVNAELRRKRLEVFRDLLISTDEPIADLAPMVGFNSPVHLRRSFHRAYGMSPRQFRVLEKGENTQVPKHPDI
jgi:LacI family transcriptional regulator